MASSDFNLNFVFDFIPALENMPPTLFDKLTKKLNENITDQSQIKGVILLSTLKRQPVIYSKRLQDYEKINELAELINLLDLTFLLRDLGSRGYHGTTTFDFPEFGLGIIKINDTDVLAVLIGSESQDLDEEYIKTTTESIKEAIVGDIGEKLNSMPVPQMDKKQAKIIDQETNENETEESGSVGGIPKPRR